MFQHLLVPLDGSRLAETALTPARVLAQQTGARVILVHIIEKNAPEKIHGERHLTQAEEACRYLDETARRVFPPEIEVVTHVHSEETQDIARGIVEHTQEFSPDLIVMCSHGGGGMRDLLLGPIAQQVIGLGKTPVLLLRPSEEEKPFQLKQILVGLDGNAQHAGCLAVGGELARVCQAKLHLLTVVHTLSSLSGGPAATGRLLPGTTSAMLDLAEQEAAQSLQGLARPWMLQGVPVCIEVRRGVPAQQILASAEKEKDDLIVLGTHGKAGMDAFWAGSVAPKVVNSARLPLLLVPVHLEKGNTG